MLAGCSSGDKDDDATQTTVDDGGGEESDGTTTEPTEEDDEAGDDGDEGESGGGFGTGSLCALMAEEAVEAALGMPVQVGIDTAAECTYDQERSDEALGVALVALEDGGPDQFEFDRTTPLGGGEIEDVPDLGDAAIYDTGFDILRVLVGDQIVTFSVIDFNVADKKAAAIALADELVSNL